MLAAALILSLLALGAHVVVPWLLAREESDSSSAARSWSLLALPLTLLAALPWLLLLVTVAGRSTGPLPPEVKLALLLLLGLGLCDLAVLTLRRHFDRPSWLLAALAGLVVAIALGHAFFSLALGLDGTGLTPVLGQLGEQGWVEDSPPDLSARPPTLGSALRALFLLPVLLFAATPLVELVGVPGLPKRGARLLGVATAAGLGLFLATLPQAHRHLLTQAGDHLTLLSALVLSLLTPWLPDRFRVPVSLVATLLTGIFLSRIVG